MLELQIIVIANIKYEKLPITIISKFSNFRITLIINQLMIRTGHK